MDIENENSMGDLGAVKKSEAVMFGEMLRSAREVAGLSVAQVADSTKISAHFIVALENGQLEKLPGRVFGKGFVRAICKVLDNDEKDYTEGYDLAFASLKVDSRSKDSTQNELESKKRAASSYRPESKSIFTYLKLAEIPPSLILACVGIVVIVPMLVWWGGSPDSSPSGAEVSQKQQKTATMPVDSTSSLSQQNEIADVSAPNSAINNSATSNDVVADPSDQQGSAQEMTVTAEPGEVSGVQELRLVVDYPVTVRLALDQAGWVSKDLDPKEHLFSFNEKARLLIMDAGAVEVFFNGKSLGFLGNKGRVRRLTFAKGQVPTPAKL